MEQRRLISAIFVRCYNLLLQLVGKLVEANLREVAVPFLTLLQTLGRAIRRERVIAPLNHMNAIIRTAFKTLSLFLPLGSDHKLMLCSLFFKLVVRYFEQGQFSSHVLHKSRRSIVNSLENALA